MKERYLKQVERLLALPRRKKREVLRDLEEAFSSALAHGEAESAVIERLGPPEEFCGSMEEQIGGGWRRRRQIAGALLAACGALLLALAAFARAHSPQETVIGQADAVTSIQVGSAVPFDPVWLLVALGLLAMLLAVVLLVCCRHKKGGAP